jgi:ABC-2 type transport system permease protein
MTYFVVGQVVGNTVFVNVEEYMGDKIRKGTIVNELKRPVTIFSQAYFHEIGNFAFNFIAKAMPIALLGAIFLQISFPGFLGSLMFLFSLFLAFNLVFLLSYSASMLIFWTKVEWSIRGSRNHVQKIFAGTLFPLFLVPEQFQLLFSILPFKYMVDGPITIFTGQSTSSSLEVILIQLIWILLLLLVAHFSWKKAKTKLTVQGG